MILKKCPSCQKDMPSALAICPYCRRDETGRSMSDGNNVAEIPDVEAQRELTALKSGDPLVRREASFRLQQRGLAAVPWLLQFLKDNPSAHTADVIMLLGHFRDRRAVPALSEAIKTGNEEMRTLALGALSQINDAEALKELIQEAERNNPGVQAYIAHVLGGYHDPQVLPALIRLSRHGSREVAFQAIWALGESGNPASIPPLRKVLSQKDPLLRSAAALSLRRLGGPVRRVYPMGLILGVLTVVAGVIGGGLIFFYK